jgi:hypothetical protein
MTDPRTAYGEALRKAKILRSRRRRVWLGDKLEHPDDFDDMPDPGDTEKGEIKNRSYVVPCANDFRDAVLELAERHNVNAGELARAVLLLMPGDAARFPDPGEPEPGDRETVILKSGANEGKNWRRKPRLQVRLAGGHNTATIRRALALALAMDRGDYTVRIEDGRGPSSDQRLREARSENTRLRYQVKAMAFEPLEHGVRSNADALYVLGFPPDATPETDEIRKRYRKLAAIHHPDSSQGDHKRMSQLNEAVAKLTKPAKI